MYDYETILFVGIINLSFFLFEIFFLFVHRKINLYHPVVIYLIYHFLGYVIRPITLGIFNVPTIWNYIGFIPNQDDLYFSCFITNIALVALIQGPIIFFNRNFFRRIYPKYKPIRIKYKNQYFLIFLFLFTLSLISMYFSYFSGGTDKLLTYNRVTDESGGQRLEGTSGYFTGLADFGKPLILLQFIAGGERNIWTILIFIAFVLVRFWVGSQRSSFVLLILTIALFILYKQDSLQIKIHLKKILGVAFIGYLLILVFDFIGSDRFVFRKLFSGEIDLASALDSYNNSRGADLPFNDFQEFDVSTAYYSKVIKFAGFSYGSQFLRLLIWPIPRQLWPDKPVVTNIINPLDYGNFKYLSLSLNVDLYSVLGIGSLILGMFIIGCLLNYLFEKANKTKNISFYCLYWTFITFTPNLYRDGIVVPIYFILLSLVPIFACIKFGGISIKEKN
ncbi:MAG TPA: O-antigen polymerase [Stenomitos sp.]